MAASVSWAQTITISNNAGLAFGKFVAGSGGIVTVTTGGGRSKTGGVLLLSSGAGAAASFTTTRIFGTGGGPVDLTYTITLPTSATLTHSTSSTTTMTVDAFTSNPTPTGALLPGETEQLSVGARLTVGNNQAPGSYSGTFDVTVNF